MRLIHTPNGYAVPRLRSDEADLSGIVVSLDRVSRIPCGERRSETTGKTRVCHESECLDLDFVCEKDVKRRIVAVGSMVRKGFEACFGYGLRDDSYLKERPSSGLRTAGTPILSDLDQDGLAVALTSVVVGQTDATNFDDDVVGDAVEARLDVASAHTYLPPREFSKLRSAFVRYCSDPSRCLGHRHLVDRQAELGCFDVSGGRFFESASSYPSLTFRLQNDVSLVVRPRDYLYRVNTDDDDDVEHHCVGIFVSSPDSPSSSSSEDEARLGRNVLISRSVFGRGGSLVFDACSADDRTTRSQASWAPGFLSNEVDPVPFFAGALFSILIAWRVLRRRRPRSPKFVPSFSPLNSQDREVS